MKTNYLATVVALFATSLFQTFASETPDILIEGGELIFEDDFNRKSKKGIGKDWFVNNKNGAEQAVLKNGTLTIEMAKDAGHSTVIRHDAPFDDGVVKVKIKLFDNKGLKLNFNDPNAKDITWAGHIMRVVFQANQVTISDDLTGVYELGIRDKRLNKDLPAAEKLEVKEFIASKQPVFKAPIQLEQWHEVTVVNIGPKVEVYIDGESVASFTSKGLDHKVKQNIVFGVGGKVEVDDLRVWSLN